MTQDEIIEMAREAGFGIAGDPEYVHAPGYDGICTEELEAFAKLVTEHEREECAKLCDEYSAVGKIQEFDRGWLACAKNIASFIRARQ